MTWLAAGFESLDDEHAAAATWARACERLFRIGLAVLLGHSLLSSRRDEVQELAHGLDCFGAIAAGEQAVVADAVEALGCGFRFNPAGCSDVKPAGIPI
jgi:hypothetical protein